MTKDIAAYVGVDWASATPYAYALEPKEQFGHRSFQHNGEGLAELAGWIRRTTAVEPGRIAI